MPVTKRYKVFYHRCPTWCVGEHEDDARIRRALPSPLVVVASERYPGDFAGRVVAVLPEGSKADSAGMAEVVLNLTDTERVGLASRRLKIDRLTLLPVPVDFDDYHGALAASLLAQFGSIENAEKAESEQGDVEPSFDGRLFGLFTRLLKDSLAKTVSQTGTGLYAVKAVPTQKDESQVGPPVGQVITVTTVGGGLGGAGVYAGGYVTNVTETETLAIVSHTNDTITLEGDLTNWTDGDDLDIFDAWATVQGAHDQFLADQGAADCTAEQEIRIYDGTYNEAVTLNAGLRPTSNSKLKIQAASGNTAVIVTNSGLGAGTRTFNNNNVDSVEYRNIEIREVVAGGAYAIAHVGIGCTIDACTLDGEGTGYAATYAGTGCLIRDCTIKRFTMGLVYGEWRVERCLFQDITDRVLWKTTTLLQLERCVFDNCNYVVYFYNDNTSPPPELSADVRNCTFYSCPYPFYFTGTVGNENMRFRAFNNIFKDSTTVFYSVGGIGRVESNYNCFHGNTNVGYFDSTAYTTLADWQAATDEDGNSPDASSLAADPLLTNPAGGDFSLAVNSPCRHAGGGSGVKKDINGDPLDPYHPDIGAVGTGIGPNVCHSN